mmetsp:Transcript_3366/g.5142  ORF Transcript_3366/g.5142 Transcript_3366/m.5142 type:complete len:94 (+) Transcript_3366:1291-1572(+)
MFSLGEKTLFQMMTDFVSGNTTRMFHKKDIISANTWYAHSYSRVVYPYSWRRDISIFTIFVKSKKPSNKTNKHEKIQVLMWNLFLVSKQNAEM